jgi:hypothetical protein
MAGSLAGLDRKKIKGCIAKIHGYDSKAAVKFTGV